MKKVCQSSMQDDLKRRLFVAAVESVLTYGFEALTLSVKDEKTLDGVYTRMLRVALNVSWEDYITNFNLYGKLTRLSDKKRQRRMSLAGHCVRHLELSSCELILWEPTYGQRSRGRPKTTYVDTLRRDTGLSSVSELQTLMEDREQWRAAIKCSQVGVG